jgi:hypothetical protein
MSGDLFTLLLPQRLSVHWSPFDRQWCVVNHALLGRLDDLRSPSKPDDYWEVQSDGIDEPLYFASETESLWATEALLTSAYTSNGIVFAVTRDTGGQVLRKRALHDMLRKHVTVDLTLHMAGMMNPDVVITAAIFAASTFGVRTYLSCTDIYKKLSLDMYPGDAAQWFQKHRDSLTKLAEKLGLGEHAVRYCVPWKSADADSKPERCMSFNGLSTHLVIAAFSTMCFAPTVGAGAIKAGPNVDKIKVFLDALLSLCGDTWSMRVVLDPDAYWIYDGNVIGRFPLLLDVEKGNIDLSQWHVAMARNWQQWAGANDLFDGSMTSISLYDFLRQTRANPLAFWLWKQLVWAIGSRLDRILCVQYKKSEQDVDAVVSVQRCDCLGDTPLHTSQELNKYFKRGHRVMSSTKHWSIAPDGGKVGNHGLVICPIADHETSMTMWAAPQDRCVLNGCVRQH